MQTNSLESAAAEVGFDPGDLIHWGPGAAKLPSKIAFADGPTRARLVLVSAINPTPAGEGKTTVSVGLAQAARRRGIRTLVALRQPSLGPVFGVKGGGTGGGRAQLQPSERINLHFTGDLHAVTAAHNLLASLADVDIYFNGRAGLDHRQMSWRRAMDLNDRFLRRTIIGLGGALSGTPREDGFDITPASEVMAVLCLARDYGDLKRRLGEMIVGATRDGTPVRARDLQAQGAMAALLRDAFLPNLVRTAEGGPALVHGGPFGNIAHGCSSLVATRLALRHADLVLTEAGFGFDLGAEKFLDIKCRLGGIWPHAVVLVATLGALKLHGGAPLAEVRRPDGAALERGLANLARHVRSARGFGLEPVVAINRHLQDSEEELALAARLIGALGVDVAVADVFGGGGEGGLELLDLVAAKARSAPMVTTPRFTYEAGDAPVVKIEKVARAIYGASSVELTQGAKRDLARAERLGAGELPICMAKTHLSLSDDATRVGAPQDFPITVREVRIAAGAGYLVPLTGEILTMPGLPREPRANTVDLLDDGTIVGLG